MANIIHPPTRLTKAQRTRPSVYLAGPFEAGAWRDEVIAGLQDLDVDVFDPRNGVWETPAADHVSAGAFAGMLSWQLDNAADASVIVFWLPRGVAATTALLQLGFLAAKRGGHKRGSTVIVGLPEDPERSILRTFAATTRVFPMPDLAGVIRVTRHELTATK
jgi:hypothetical protein